jgi:hypothetical protein
VGTEVLLALRAAERAQVRREADAAEAVRVRGERGVRELEQQAAERRRFVAHAPLFVDDVALGVELAEHRVRHAAALEQRPQLQPVRRHRIEVRRDVVRRVGVRVLAARLLDPLAEVVRHDQVASRSLCRVERLLELLEPRGIRARALAALVEQRAPRLFLGRHARLLGRGVRRADPRRPLERHVLHHVGEPRRADLIARAAGVDDRDEAEHRRLMPLDHDETQPVRQRELLHLLLDRLETGAYVGRGRLRARLRGGVRPGGGNDGHRERDGDDERAERTTLRPNEEGWALHRISCDDGNVDVWQVGRLWHPA